MREGANTISVHLECINLGQPFKTSVSIKPQAVPCLECSRWPLSITEKWERTGTAAASRALHLGQVFTQKAASHNSNSSATDDMP